MAGIRGSPQKIRLLWVQDRTGPSWASNNYPLKDLSNTRALKHLAPLATDYWAASHSFVEPGHSCFCSKFEKIVSVSEFLAGRMQWGRPAAGMETVGPPTNSKCDSCQRLTIWSGCPAHAKTKTGRGDPRLTSFVRGPVLSNSVCTGIQVLPKCYRDPP